MKIACLLQTTQRGSAQWLHGMARSSGSQRTAYGSTRLAPSYHPPVTAATEHKFAVNMQSAGASLRPQIAGGSVVLAGGKGSAVCTRCNKTFSSRATLARHMQLHTGQFSFYCEICKKGYNVKCNYDDHMAKHEGRTFPCSWCNRRYTTLRSLKGHMKSEHEQ